jgi:hypothetical protein
LGMTLRRRTPATISNMPPRTQSRTAERER